MPWGKPAFLRAFLLGFLGPEAITIPSQVYSLSTADVCFLVRPGSIRLCGSRGIIPLVRSGLKAQRIPFVRLPIVTFTLHTDAASILEEKQYYFHMIKKYVFSVSG
jgi:hypothetical protein